MFILEEKKERKNEFKNGEQQSKLALMHLTFDFWVLASTEGLKVLNLTGIPMSNRGTGGPPTIQKAIVKTQVCKNGQPDSLGTQYDTTDT
jgi:hypothetical protein